jgi:hypothetical protein
MPTSQPSTWLHSNRYSADKACEHCQGVIRHETWCITRSPVILYAFRAVIESSNLSTGDQIILHALGAKWADNPCSGTGTCNADKASAP